MKVNKIMYGKAIDNRLIRGIIIRNERDNMKSYKCITINGKQVRLHRVLMEAYIGRKLKSWELVHHNDGDKHNNELSNLSITTRSIHMKTHKIGESSRFKKKYGISREKLRFLYEDGGLTIQAMANLINVNFGVIWRRMKEYKIRENMICIECGRKIESYVRARQCNRCYHRAYQRMYRAKQTRI